VIGRRGFCAAALACPALIRPARASPVIRLLVGASAGVGNDLEARSFAPFLERHLPQAEIQVINLPGQAGLTAYRALADAGTEPLTLGWVASPSLGARAVDHDDPMLLTRLALIAAVQEEPLVLVAPASGTLTSVREVLRNAAADAGAVPLGTPPAGSPPHLGALDLQARSGIALNIVPFPSVAAVREAGVDGNVAAALMELGDAIVALRDGRLVGLGVTAPDRVAALPDVPTFGEGGAEAGVALVATVLRGLAAPAGLAPAMEASLTEGLRGVIGDPEYKAQGDDSGFSLVWLDGVAWRGRIAAEQAALQTLWQASPWLPGKPG
jgi:tripartite-type tricarboxylate transporter receptor subunit TctC